MAHVHPVTGLAIYVPCKSPQLQKFHYPLPMQSHLNMITYMHVIGGVSP